MLFQAHSGGPIHLAQDEPHDQLSWCGVRRQFRHVDRKGGRDEVTCSKCLRQMRLGHSLAWGGR